MRQISQSRRNDYVFDEETADEFTIESRKRFLKEEKDWMDAARDIQKSNNKEMRMLEERVFVKFFLPVFAGLEKDKEKEAVILTKWTEIAGSGVDEVSIVDQYGKTVLIVPPMMNLNIFKPNRKNHVGLHGELFKLSPILEINPGGFTVAVQQALENAYIKTVDGSIFEQQKNKWADIFSRYSDYLKKYALDNNIDIGLSTEQLQAPTNAEQKRVTRETSSDNPEITWDDDF